MKIIKEEEKLLEKVLSKNKEEQMKDETLKKEFEKIWKALDELNKKAKEIMKNDNI